MTIPDAFPHDSPVFVDASGRRRRVLRTAVGLASLGGFAYVTLLCFALTDSQAEPASLFPAPRNENTTTTVRPSAVPTPPVTVRITQPPTLPAARPHPVPPVTTAAGAPVVNIAPPPVPAPAPVPPPVVVPAPTTKPGSADRRILPTGLVKRRKDWQGDGG